MYNKSMLLVILSKEAPTDGKAKKLGHKQHGLDQPNRKRVSR